MATFVGRTIKFVEDSIERIGVVQRVSAHGAFLVNVTDGIDDLKQIIIPLSQPVQIVRHDT